MNFRANEKFRAFDEQPQIHGHRHLLLSKLLDPARQAGGRASSQREGQVSWFPSQDP